MLLEATGNAVEIARILEPFVARVVSADAKAQPFKRQTRFGVDESLKVVAANRSLTNSVDVAVKRSPRRTALKTREAPAYLLAGLVAPLSRCYAPASLADAYADARTNASETNRDSSHTP